MVDQPEVTAKATKRKRETHGALAKLSTARRALASAKTFEEVKNIHDVAEAARVYAKQAKLGVEVFNEAAEIKLRAERMAGEFLAGMPGMGARGGDRKSKATMTFDFRSAGISPNQSKRWQSIASIPPEHFDAELAKFRQSENEITTKHFLKLGARAAKPTRNGKAAHDAADGESADIAATLEPLAGQKFGCIYADPPWKYGNQATRAATDNHYDTMTIADLCAMQVASLAADDAHLHLWTTNAFIREAFDVIDAWGFEYRSMFIWCKNQMGIGNYWRVSHEILLLGIRGNAKRFNERNHKSWLELPRGKHSAKPEKVREIIEHVSPGPRLELFGRKQVAGWTVFGNQIESPLFL